jgi:hypothetical protein
MINLTNRRIQDLIPFEKFMLSFSFINSCDLSRNRINDDGLEQLIGFFSTKIPYLKHLNLESNYFSEQSAKLLV